MMEDLGPDNEIAPRKGPIESTMYSTTSPSNNCGKVSISVVLQPIKLNFLLFPGRVDERRKLELKESKNNTKTMVANIHFDRQ